MKNFYKSKKILVTGHTGFKGSWICSWLLTLGAKVYGYSSGIPTNPSLYTLAGLDKHVESHTGNILDVEHLCSTVNEIKPDIIFHIAAQPITSLAYKNPIETFEINIMGTAGILEALRKLEYPCSMVSITSDKSYLNKEWVWGYRETDDLGGKDPYSASKAGAEMVLNSYYNTYFKENNSKRIAVVRAGNIIGGGDWGYNRIVPDCIRAWENGEAVVLRSPKSVRPWQHVLEPIYGYLLLAMNLYSNSKFNGEAFNFGPNPMEVRDVYSLVEKFSSLMKERGVDAPILVKPENTFNEAEMLKLNCEKALAWLGWKPLLSTNEALEYTASWYFEGCWNGGQILELNEKQISNFENIIESIKSNEEAHNLPC